MKKFLKWFCLFMCISGAITIPIQISQGNGSTDMIAAGVGAIVLFGFGFLKLNGKLNLKFSKKMFLIIPLVAICGFGYAIYYVSNSNPSAKSNKTEEVKKEEETNIFNYEDIDNFAYVVEALTTMIGESPNIKWTESKNWVDENSQVQYFTGYVENHDIDTYYKFRFAGDKCVHFSFAEQTIISDIDAETAWMDEHSKK